MKLQKLHVPHIIGKRGARINWIRDHSGADIKVFDGQGDDDLHKVIIAGRPEAIKVAMDEINKSIVIIVFFFPRRLRFRAPPPWRHIFRRQDFRHHIFNKTENLTSEIIPLKNVTPG